MYADDQDRISTLGKPASSTGRSPLIDVAIVVLVLLVAGFFTYRYFAQLEPDYDLLDEPGPAGDASGYGRQAGASTYSDDDEGYDPQALLQPRPLEDQALIEQYELPESTPQLNDSDPGLHSQLEKLKSLNGVVAWSDASDLARRFVVLVYNLAEGEVAHKYLPVNAPDRPFLATGSGRAMKIDPKSYLRYNFYAEAFAGMDSQRAVAIYRYFWPALEKAFMELGEPRKSLHVELIKGIDHLLEAPDIEGDIYLHQPSVYYKYADPKLEALSAAHKQMIRLGPKNRALVKAKLLEIKELLLRG